MPNGDFIELGRGFKPKKPEKGVAPVEVRDPIGDHLDARKKAEVSFIREIPIPPELLPELYKGREELVRLIDNWYKEASRQSKEGKPGKELSSEIDRPSPEEEEWEKQRKVLIERRDDLGEKITPGAEKFIEKSLSSLQEKINSERKKRENLLREK